MADKLISQLGARAAVLTTDLMPLEPNAGPPAEKATIAQLVTLLDTLYAPITGGAYVLKAGDTMTGRLIITQATANTSILTSTGYSLTGANAQNMLDLAGTWNTSGNPSLFKLAITDTASGATSKFLELLGGAAGATAMANITKFGQIQAGDGAAALTAGTPGFSFVGASGVGFRRVSTSGAMFVASGLDCWYTAAANINMRNNGFFGWSSTASPDGATDIELYRDAANAFAQRRSTIAQTFRLYRTFTDLSNYERLALQTAAGQMIIAAETAGTGTDDLDLVLTPAGVGRVTLPGGAQLLKTTAAMTSGAAAGLGTLSNSPTAGNPAVWCPIMFNGVQHWFPCWT